VKLFSSNNYGRMTFRSRLAAVIGLGLAATAAACSGGATATSPSGVAPSSLDAKPNNNGSNRFFAVTVAPTTLTAGQAAALTVTIFNTAGSSDNQGLGSVHLVVPAGLTVNSATFVSGAQPWLASVAGQDITFYADGGNHKSDRTSSETFTVNVTASSNCQTVTFDQPTASNETPNDPFVAGPWVYAGNVLQVNISGCTACTDDAPAAPSIATHYLKNVLHMNNNDDPFKNIVAQVANHMEADARFDGLLPCDAGYEAAVIAFVNSIVS
jgi:hypothetical protein